MLGGDLVSRSVGRTAPSGGQGAAAAISPTQPAQAASVAAALVYADTTECDPLVVVARWVGPLNLTPTRSHARFEADRAGSRPAHMSRARCRRSGGRGG